MQFTSLVGISVDGVAQSSAQGIFIGSATAMPTASADLNGVMVLYVGTTGTYTQNTFYMCNGTAWNQVDVFPDFNLTPNTAVIVGGDGSLQSSAVSTTELSYVQGVTSSIQGQFTALGGQLSDVQGEVSTLQGQMSTAQGDITALQSGKQDAITGGASSITSSNLTINSALVSDGNGKVAVSPVTSAELAFVQGATSNIQSQINTLASQIASMSGFEAQVVAELPASGEPNVMYFVPSSGGSGQNIYDEYLYVNNNWEQVGSTAFSLNIQQNASGITINGTALQDASATQDGLMTSAQVNALTTAGNNIGTLQGQMTQAESDIDGLQSDMTTAQSNIGTLQTAQSTTDSRLSTCESDIDTLQGQMSTVQGNVSTIQGQIPNFVPNTQIGGTSLGLVKNGGNVVIGSDGTMNANSGNFTLKTSGDLYDLITIDTKLKSITIKNPFIIEYLDYKSDVLYSVTSTVLPSTYSFEDPSSIESGSRIYIGSLYYDAGSYSGWYSITYNPNKDTLSAFGSLIYTAEVDTSISSGYRLYVTRGGV